MSSRPTTPTSQPHPAYAAGVREDTAPDPLGCTIVIAVCCGLALVAVCTVIGAADILYSIAARLGWVP